MVGLHYVNTKSQPVFVENKEEDLYVIIFNLLKS